MSDEITREEKVAFLKHMFPERMYNFGELAKIFKRSSRTIEYWVMIYEVPTVKWVGSPVVTQDSLISWLIKADSKNCKEEKNQGIQFVLEELKKDCKKR